MKRRVGRTSDPDLSMFHVCLLTLSVFLQTDEYKVEAIQAPKVSWQQDPRFHDSSSEEEEDEQEEDEEQRSTTAKSTE